MKLFLKSFFRIFLSFVLPLLSGCVVHFSNSEYRTEGEFRRVYVPSVTDDGTLGGNAIRVSAGIRNKLAANTRIIMTSQQDARWALDIAIKGRSLRTDAWIDCKEHGPTKTVFSGAAICENLGFNQSKISSEREELTMKVTATAIDLQTGQVIKSRSYTLKSPIFDVIGNDEAQRELASVSQIHALRYVENIDTQVSNIAVVIADFIEGDFF